MTDRGKVKTMEALGISRTLIAKRIGCSVAELDRRYAEELRRALPEMRAKVGASLFAAAKGGDIRAIIFWLKTRAGWRETICREVEETVVSPSPEQPRALAFIPCNGRCSLPKIADPHKRRAEYERVLGRRLHLPEASEYQDALSAEERRRSWEQLVNHVRKRWPET
jgi:hypothetical protein